MKIKVEGGRRELCMNASFGFVIQRKMMFGALVALVGLARCTENTELVLGRTEADLPKSHIHGLELYFDNVIVV